MSVSALYYPNVTIAVPRRSGQNQDYEKTDIKLLTTALLLWDDLEVIVPYGGYQPPAIIGHDQTEQASIINQGFESVIKPRVIRDDEMDKLYTELEKLVYGKFPDSLKFEPRMDNFDMYPEKLSPKIWQLLKDAELVEADGFRFKRDFALILMGLIAEICAGASREKITNYTDAHEAYSRLRAVQTGGILPDQNAPDTSYSTLATISLRAVDAGKIPLERLVKLRIREKEDGFLPPLRRKYRAAIDRCVQRLKTEAKSKNDLEQIQREFEAEMHADFQHLKEMLQMKGFSLAFDKPVSVLLQYFAGSPLAALRELLNFLPSFRLERQKILEEHQSAWLFRLQ